MTHNTISASRLSDFEQFLHAEERSPGTIAKYLRDVRGFTDWLGDRPLEKASAAGWKEHLQSATLCPETINSKLSALNQFLKFLDQGDCCVKYLRIQRRLFRGAERELSRADYTRLLETAAATGRTRLSLLMDHLWYGHPRLRAPVYHSGGHQRGADGGEPEGQDPHYPHPRKAVPETAKVRQKTKNRLR